MDAGILNAATTLLRTQFPQVSVNALAAFLEAGQNPVASLPRKSVTFKEAALLAHVTPRTIGNWVTYGWLTRIPLGGRIARIRLDELEKLLTDGRVKDAGYRREQKRREAGRLERKAAEAKQLGVKG